MDKSKSQKREGDELDCKDLSGQKNKKPKMKNEDSITLFLEKVSGLSTEKKNIIRKLGFGCVLDFSCTSNIDDIFCWLADQFDTDSGSVNLENGFNFTMTPDFASKILGTPCGPNPVELDATKYATDIIHNVVQMQEPTIENLCALLPTDLNEESFSQLFMLTFLTAFISHRSTGAVNPKFFPNLVNVQAIPNLDWSSFIFNWLITSIEKYQHRKKFGDLTDIGFCKFLLVISYFEFLITSEFNLGVATPRLSLGDTNVVNSYIALDSQHGSKNKFGRLPRKHISSTPFKGTQQQVDLPIEIQNYIESKFGGTNLVEDKMKLRTLSYNFFQKIVKNSIPLLKRYIDDLHDVSTGDRRKYCSEQSRRKFFESMPLFKDIKVPSDHISTEIMLQQIVNNFSKDCSVNDPFANIDLPKIEYDIEHFLGIGKIENSALVEIEQSEGFDAFLSREIQELLKESREQREINTNKLINCKFNLETMSFFEPLSKIESTGNYSIQISPQPAAKALGDIPLVQATNSISENIKHNEPTSGIKFEPITQQNSRHEVWGLSLNERLSGKKMRPIFQDNNSDFPSFNLFNEEESKSTFPSNISSSRRIDEVDPILRLALDQYEKEMIENDNRILESHKVESKPNHSNDIASSGQIIFANMFEHELYKCVTSSKPEISLRICKVNNVWVNHRTLALSMSQGGWVHPHVMDCFGMTSSA